MMTYASIILREYSSDNPRTLLSLTYDEITYIFAVVPNAAKGCGPDTLYFSFQFSVASIVIFNLPWGDRPGAFS